MELQRIFEQLVAFNTESDRSNREMTDFICEVLLQLGFVSDGIQVIPSSGNDGVEKCNLIATKGEGTGGLMLAGHMDTVSPEPLGHWHSDPFRLSESLDKKRWHGLGTTDMKGFLAAAIKVAGDFSASSLRQPLTLVFTHDEETSMIGAKNLRRSEILTADFAIVGEPTEMVPVRMHKGWLGGEFIIQGKAGHASDPRSGQSAIESACQLICRLQDYRRDLEEFVKPGMIPPYPTLNIGRIKGGEGVNKIPESCRIEFEIRPIPGQLIEDIEHDLKKMAEEMGEIGDQRVAKFHLSCAPTGTMETPEDSLIVRLTEEITGVAAIGVSFNTEATIYQEAGIPTIVLGPGSINQAHQSDEFIAKKSLDQAVETLGKIVARVCREGGDQ